MKSFLFSLIFIVSIFKLNAQIPKTEFGKIIHSDFILDPAKVDTTAEAVVLFDKGETRFIVDDQRGICHETEYFIRKKILKKSALELATIKIPYYSQSFENSQILTNIKAASYNLINGNLTKEEVRKKDILEEKLQNSYFEKKISIPNVQVNSIIEYTYTVQTPVGVENNPRTWYFQGEHPVLWSTYQITIPDWIYYKMIMGGYQPLFENKSEKINVNVGDSKLNTVGMKYLFIMNDIPAFKDEDFITTEKDFTAKIEFELASVSLPNFTKSFTLTWADLNRTVQNSSYFGEKLKRNSYLKSIYSQFKDIKDPKEKLEKVYYYFQNYFSSEDDLSNTIYVENLQKSFDNKKGSNNQINMMFISTLKELDFEVTPVILSTRTHGKVNEAFPLLRKFNYTVAKVKIGEEMFYLDAAEKDLKMGMLPKFCLNGTAFEINENNGNIIQIIPTEKKRIFESVRLNLDKNSNKFTGKYESFLYGYKAVEVRSEIRGSKLEDYFDKLKKNSSEITIKKPEILNLNDNNKNLTLKFDFETNDEFDQDIIYLNPFFSGKIDKNPFKSADRKFPVDFAYPTEFTYKIDIEIPEGYEVETLPANINMFLPEKIGQFAYAVGLDPTKKIINLMSKFSLKNTIYYGEQYGDLRELYNRVVQKHGEQIVLKKKNL